MLTFLMNYISSDYQYYNLHSCTYSLNTGALPGVNVEPKNQAQCLHNIRQALTRLGDRGSMPVDHLFSEEEILQGKTSVIVPLLLQVRKAYGHHLNSK